MGRPVRAASACRVGASSTLARLRVEALRVGLEEMVKLRHEIRMGPVDLKTSQEVRLKRLQPRAVLRARRV